MTYPKHFQNFLWLHSTDVAYLLLTQQPGFDSRHSQQIFRGKIIDVAEVNQQCWLQESGQWLEI